MKRRRVVFAPEAVSDIIALYDYIAEQSSLKIADDYIQRLETYCRGFDLFGERGSRRSDIREGLRVIAFERRTTLAFRVDDDKVIFLRVLYGGQDLEAALR